MSANTVPFDRSYKYWLSKANKQRQSGHFTEALVMLRHAYEAAKRDDILFMMADIYCETGSFYAAKRLMSDLILSDRDNAEAYYWLGIAALGLNDEALGEDALATALLKGRHNSDLADKAQSVLSEYNWSEAPVLPRRRRALYYYHRAASAYYDGRDDDATAYALLSVRRGATSEAFTMLGQLYMKHGKNLKGIRCIRKAVRLSPHSPVLLAMLAQAYSVLDLDTAAKAACKRALSACRTADDLGYVGMACFFTGQTGLMRGKMNEIMRRWPDSNDHMYVRAAYLADTGRIPEALRVFTAILDRDPEDTDARAALRIMAVGGKVHLIRVPEDDSEVRLLCQRQQKPGDQSFIRLVHGLIISLGGVVSTGAVRARTLNIWLRMNRVQKRECDRNYEWPNAFYQYIRRHTPVPLPEFPAFWQPMERPRRARRILHWMEKSSLTAMIGKK